jgi:hypothetical protein
VLLLFSKGLPEGLRVRRSSRPSARNPGTLHRPAPLSTAVSSVGSGVGGGLTNCCWASRRSRAA